MNLPKSVIIAGRTYTIIKDMKRNGGWFNTSKLEIRIGLKGKVTDDEIRIILLHEIFEVIFTERNLRYKLGYNPPENGHYLFSFNHQQFEDAMFDVALALKGITL